MKIDRAKQKSIRLVTITVERLSDNSRITFSIPSNKTIKYLRSLLNHHLPPYSPNQFDLYSYQRGALIHFRPEQFKLDYFPVIFDHNILLLQMDDRNFHENFSNCSLSNQINSKLSFVERLISWIRKQNKPTSNSSVTCSSICKRIFHKRTHDKHVLID